MVEELIPPGAEALRDIKPGSRIVRINGDSVKSWDAVVSSIINTPEREVRIELAGGSTVVVPIHPDALEERLKAAQALQPHRKPIIDSLVADKPAERAGMRSGDIILEVNGTPIREWYELLDTVQASAGRTLTIAATGNISK